MTPLEIQHFCIVGAEAYLRFLIANNRGVEQIGVARIEPVPGTGNSYFKLTLQRRLFNPETVSLHMAPPGQDYGPEHFRVVEYDADAKSLIIEVRTDTLDLRQRPPAQVTVISDLRFLVTNVKVWFEQHGAELALPVQEHATQVGPPPALPLEPCQQEAVRRSLTLPLTYVWGPPGTGKTRHVLVAAAVELLASGKKVGIYAPTNNALEQAMAAVILAAERSGIDRRKFLRVGHPSAKFAREFPEACEIQGLQGLISEARRQRANYLKVLHHRRGATVLNSVAALHHQTGELRTMLDRRRDICGLLAGGVVRKIVSMLTGERQSLERELADLERRIQGQLEVIRRTRTESEPLNRIIAALDFTNIESTAAAVSQLEARTRR